MKYSTNEAMLSDWPPEGDIDLSIHDLPHKSSTTEWWYLHSHLKDNQGREFGLFVSFFRHALSVDKSNGLYNYSHSVIWALTDIQNKKYYTKSLVDKEAPKIGIKTLKAKNATKDPFIRKATMEMLKKGVVPLPDELLIHEPIIPWDKLDLIYDDQRFTKLNDASYKLELHDRNQLIDIELNFKPLIAPVRYGTDGVVRNSSVEDMFYYFIPNCAVQGQIILGENKIPIVNSSGWYDHEFGFRPAEKKSIINKDEVAWNWIGVQLSDGYQLLVFDVHTKKQIKNKSTVLILIDPNGTKHTTLNYNFDSYGTKWLSTKTFNEYPTRWKITSNELKLDLRLEAVFENQEFGTVISKPAFWEGRLNVTGTHLNKSITGYAYLERHGHVSTETISDFLKSVSKATLSTVKKILPLKPDTQKLEELVSKVGNKRFTKNLDKKIYIEKLITPIREIIDRGGKSWRSYATVACWEAVGGNSQEAIDWLALPELIHVGSLMVDDVQDKSSIRRGGPAAHKLHGEAIAINSGNAAYFIGQICIYRANISVDKKLQVYDWYFEAMRASHSGQAMDIYGLDYLMEQAIKSKSVAASLPLKVLSIHKLKSAAPASYLAMIGACLGGGSDEQIKGLAQFFEALGISFQIIDDVLNLKGFKDNYKTKAEDLSAGKITYPVSVAIKLLSIKDKQRLWDILKQKTKNKTLLTEAIDIMQKIDALNISERYARSNIEKAWRKLDPLIKDTMVKINLRAFSWFVLERTY